MGIKRYSINVFIDTFLVKRRYEDTGSYHITNSINKIIKDAVHKHRGAFYIVINLDWMSSLFVTGAETSSKQVSIYSYVTIDNQTLRCQCNSEFFISSIEDTYGLSDFIRNSTLKCRV